VTGSKPEESVSGCLVTLATPVGRSAIATVLLHAKDAAKGVGENFQPASGQALETVPLNRIVFGTWKGSEGLSEELVVCRRSEQTVEIHCHGGTAASEAIIASLVDAGCHRVDWPQWVQSTEGDLISAEARIALSAARTTRAAEILLNQLDGALRKAIDKAVHFLKADEPKPASQIIDRMLALADVGIHLSKPWQVVLAGSPNVGKSSLINAMLGYQRAIVFHQPGTTRDVVSATTAIYGWSLELADTAGLRAAEGAIEEEGINLARERAARADLLLLVFDASRPWNQADAELCRQYPHALLVRNKCDLSVSHAGRPKGINTSAVQGEGIEQLLAAIIARLVPVAPGLREAVPFTQRQVALLSRVADRLGVDDRDTAIKLLEEICDDSQH